MTDTLPIVTVPAPSLRERSIEIDRDILLRKETQILIDRMIPTMYGDDGIGLAAPQVGHNIRVCIIGKDAIPKKYAFAGSDLVLVNPMWTKTSRRIEWDTEGCLSVPGLFGKVKRYKHIALTALDRHGNPLQCNASAFFARVIQHEVDHLDGILFIDKAIDVYEKENGGRY